MWWQKQWWPTNNRQISSVFCPIRTLNIKVAVSCLASWWTFIEEEEARISWERRAGMEKEMMKQLDMEPKEFWILLGAKWEVHFNSQSVKDSTRTLQPKSNLKEEAPWITVHKKPLIPRTWTLNTKRWVTLTQTDPELAVTEKAKFPTHPVSPPWAKNKKIL